MPIEEGYEAKKNINKVYGICLSEDITSKKVLDKSGFQKEYEDIGVCSLWSTF